MIFFSYHFIEFKLQAIKNLQLWTFEIIWFFRIILLNLTAQVIKNLQLWTFETIWFFFFFCNILLNWTTKIKSVQLYFTPKDLRTRQQQPTPASKEYQWAKMPKMAHCWQRHQKKWFAVMIIFSTGQLITQT